MLLPFDVSEQKVLEVLSAMKTPIIIQKQACPACGFSKTVVSDVSTHTSVISKEALCGNVQALKRHAKQVLTFL